MNKNGAISIFVFRIRAALLSRARTRSVALGIPKALCPAAVVAAAVVALGRFYVVVRIRGYGSHPRDNVIL